MLSQYIINIDHIINLIESLSYCKKMYTIITQIIISLLIINIKFKQETKKVKQVEDHPLRVKRCN